MIKILHIITSLGVGGAEKQLSQLVIGSDNNHYQHSVVTLTNNIVYKNELDQKNIKIYALNFRSKWKVIIEFFKLMKIIRKEKPNVIQTWLYHADLIGFLAGKLCGIKTILWNVRCSDMNFKKYSNYTKYVLKLCSLLSNFPNRVVVNSKMGLEEHQRQGYKTKKWELIPNGINTNVYKYSVDAKKSVRNLLKISDDAVLIGMIGRFDPMKDHATFLKSAETIAEKYSNVYFLLAGKDVTEENKFLTSALTKTNLKNKFYFLGLRSDIPYLLSSLDVLVLPSAFGEGFPNIVGEAMACEIPCVVTDVGDSANLVQNFGKVIPPMNVQSLTKALTEMINLSAEERRKIGKMAREHIVKHYAHEATIQRYENLYQSLCVK